MAVAGAASCGISIETSGGGTNGGGVSIFGGGGGGGSSSLGASSIMRVSIGPNTASTIRCDMPDFNAQNIPACNNAIKMNTSPRRVKNELSDEGA
jgi:hypothetical protein